MNLIYKLLIIFLFFFIITIILFNFNRYLKSEKLNRVIETKNKKLDEFIEGFRNKQLIENDNNYEKFLIFDDLWSSYSDKNIDHFNNRYNSQYY